MKEQYNLEGDYYIPNLAMPKQEKIILNKYERMRLNYLKEDKKADYTIMLMNGTLNTHLKCKKWPILEYNRLLVS